MPLAGLIPVESLIGFETPRILAVVLLIVVCFLTGLFAKTSLAKKLVNWLETVLLSNLPGYTYFKNLGEEAAGLAPAHGQQAVIVRFDDASQIGFIVERILRDALLSLYRMRQVPGPVASSSLKRTR